MSGELWAESYNAAKYALQRVGLWATPKGAAAMDDPEAVGRIRELAHVVIDQLEGRELLGIYLLAARLAGPGHDVDAPDLGIWLGAIEGWE